MTSSHPEIKAKGEPEWTTLHDHLMHVLLATEKIAKYTEHNMEIARLGAIFHDIGKAHPVFQKRLKGENSRIPFRHEIASLFFLPLIREDWQPAIIEMIIAHHKEIIDDRKGRGILDLRQNEPDTLPFHLGPWEEWSPIALDILASFGVKTRPITIEEAEKSYQQVVAFCQTKYRERGYSEWRGLLMGADHFASAMISKTEEKLQNLFIKPKLTFFNRTHPLFPLSYFSSDSGKPHTMVVASTGAGKTDYLFRRCNGRVFYTLPFQASINAMYARLQNDLSKDNPKLNIKLLHAASSLIETEDGDREDVILQRHSGSSIKVLTPYQLAGIAFASKGYEAMILDIKGCDVILDEVHTYSGISQAIVLKIVSVLKSLDCRLHIGTATMPTILYNKIKTILGQENVLETRLTVDELDKYDRHRIHKVSSFQETETIIQEAVNSGQKILVVCNRIQHAQEIYEKIKIKYPQVDSLLLHSRFKRKDRKGKEKQLMGLDKNGKSSGQFNTSEQACIVVSTQVVEVSLDISFDLMITACAPLDSLIQRFGRINRKRDEATIGKIKPIYVIAPPDDEKEARPYELDVIQKSYEVLSNDEVLHERELQHKIDEVFTEIDFLSIEEHAVYLEDGTWEISPLINGKAWLMKILEIDSVVCITEDDIGEYIHARFQKRMGMEIPARYFSVKHLERLEEGNCPYIIPGDCYSEDVGFTQEKLKNHKGDFIKQTL